MSLLAWAVTIAFTAYSSYRIGCMVEMGRREKELEELEERAFQRSKRRGGIRLSTMKIRR